MRNLKKLLALVLALMMVVSVMVTVNAASTTKDYSTVVKALQTYGVLKGYEDGQPHPEKDITRAQMAAIVYRVMTGDTESTDAEVADKYGSYAARFTDAGSVANKKWFTGYIGWCANEGVLKGYPGKSVKPDNVIKGYEVEAMLLRVLGYDKNNEYTGNNWQFNVMSDSTKSGINKNVPRDAAEVFKRGEVAQLTYDAAINANRVALSVYPNVGYYPVQDKNGNYSHLIVPASAATTRDQWGIPSQTQNITFTWPDNDETNEVELVVEPKADFWTAEDHCDVAVTLGLTKATAINAVYTNGLENQSSMTLYPLNQTAQIGGQGRHTLIYNVDGAWSIVYIDTLLAEVTEVKNATFDSAGHLKTEATLSLRIYDGPKASPAVTTSTATSNAGTEGVTTVTLTNGSTNWDYTEGQFLLVNYHQKDAAGKADSDQRLTARTDYTGSQDWNKDGVVDVNDFVSIIGVATAITGKQTVVSVNGNAHTVSGTKYPDNNRYVLDEAGTNMDKVYTWFFDTKGNVIGSAEVKTASSFGVINKIYWTGSDGDGFVYAEVTFANGTTGKLKVNRVSVYNSQTLYQAVADDDNALSGIATNAYGKANMTFGDDKLYVNADAAVNAEADKENTTKEDGTATGVIAEHMFKIIPAKDDKYDFVELGGDGTDTPYTHSSAITPGVSFEKLYNDTTDVKKGVPTAGSHLKVDDNTVFLIRSVTPTGYSYSSVTGYNNIVNYISGEVDWANTDKDDAAEYVYIKASPETESAWHVFFAKAVTVTDKGDSKQQMRYDINGNAYVVYGYLDGVETTITVPNATLKTALTASGITGWDGSYDTNLTSFINKDNGNTLWYVKINGGYVVDFDGAASDGKAASDTSGAIGATVDGSSTDGAAMKTDRTGMDANLTGTYEKQSLLVQTVQTATKVEGNVIKLGSTPKELNISGANVVVGSWDLLANASSTDKVVVYVVYNDKATITQAYIFHEDEGTQYTPGGTPSKSGALTITATTVTCDANGTELTLAGGQITGTTDYQNCTATVTAVIEKWTDGGWTSYGTVPATTVSVSSGTGNMTTLTANIALSEGNYKITIKAVSGAASAEPKEISFNVTA